MSTWIFSNAEMFFLRKFKKKKKNEVTDLENLFLWGFKKNILSE